MTAGTNAQRRAAIIQGAWLEGALIARTLMETIWVTIWYQVFLSNRQHGFTTGLFIFGVLFITSLLVRLFSLRTDWRPGLRPGMFGLWIVGLFLFSLKGLVWPQENLGIFQTIPRLIEEIGRQNFDFGVLFHTIFIPLLIWRGINLGDTRGSLNDTIQSFKLGVLFLLVYGAIFIQTITPISVLPAASFILMGLISMSINRIADLIPLRGGRIPSSSRVWWLAILVSGVFLVLISFTFSSLVKGVVPYIVYFLIGLTILPFLAGFILLAFIGWLIISRFRPDLGKEIGLLLNNLSMRIIQEQSGLLKNWDKINRQSYEQYIFWAVAALIVIIIMIFIFVDIRSRRSRIRLILQDENINNIVNRLKPAKENAGIPRLNRPSFNRFLAAARIRQIYQELIELAGTLGEERKPAQTPLEFLPRLITLLPEDETGLRKITNAYLNVRYGEIPESQQEVREIENTWNTIRANGKTLIAKYKLEQKNRTSN